MLTKFGIHHSLESCVLSVSNGLAYGKGQKNQNMPEILNMPEIRYLSSSYILYVWWHT